MFLYRNNRIKFFTKSPGPMSGPVEHMFDEEDKKIDLAVYLLISNSSCLSKVSRYSIASASVGNDHSKPDSMCVSLYIVCLLSVLLYYVYIITYSWQLVNTFLKNFFYSVSVAKYRGTPNLFSSEVCIRSNPCRGQSRLTNPSGHYSRKR